MKCKEKGCNKEVADCEIYCPEHAEKYCMKDCFRCGIGDR